MFPLPPLGSSTTRSRVSVCERGRDWFCLSALVGVACGSPPDRHVYGESWVPPADTLGGIDLDTGSDDDGAATTEVPAADDGGAAGEGPVGDEGPLPDPGDHGDVGGSTSGPPMADTGDDGGPAGSPYAGGWDVGDCQDQIVATGTSVGGIVPDFQLTDQFGDTVRLYDFCHKAVFLTAGSFW